jgi:hypothetical protein
MIEQTLLSAAIILVNISIYFLVFGKKERKIKIAFIYITHLIFLLPLLINFQPKLFQYTNYLFLLMLSWGMGLFYVLLILFRQIWFDLLDALFPQGHLFINVHKLFFKNAHYIAFVSLIILQVGTIYDLDLFAEITKDFIGN